MSETEKRELDIFIAEHVMGWNKVGPWRGDSLSTFCVHPEDKVVIRPTGPNVTWREWMPTEHPSAAMEVLKKCCEWEDSVTVQCTRDKSRWACGTAIAPTLELAICLFAKQLFSK